MNCPKCGFNNNTDAIFCKKCGYNLNENKSKINRFNDEINILAVSLGLIVSVIFLFIGAALFGGIFSSGTVPLNLYIIMVLLAMAFFGGVTTGILGCETSYDGSINGAFLSLIILINMGFLAGILLFVVSGIASSFASAFGPSLASSSALTPTTSVSSEGVLDVLSSIAEFIASVVLIFIAGALVDHLESSLKRVIKTFKLKGKCKRCYAQNEDIKMMKMQFTVKNVEKI